jgi:hypothetical protein
MAFKIAYGAGHYINTAGKRLPKELDENQTREWVLNDRVARAFAEAASQYEDVELLRLDDPTGKKDTTLAQRVKKANDWEANFYLSIHHNAGANNTSAGGLVVFSYPGSTTGAEYRNAIYDACIANDGIRGNRSNPKTTAKYYVLKYSNMPAVLIECGFMDSKIDYSIILDEEFSKKQGYGIMEGISKIAGLKKTTTSNVEPVKPSVSTAVKSIDELAQEVIAGKHGTGAARRASLGDLYDEVQARVNEILTGKNTEVKEPVKKPEKTIDELAKEVIDGKHGTGADRKKSLGDKYDAVQARVNEILTGKSTAASAKTIDQLAKEVIAGKHGTGAARRASLGELYNEVQKRVNELLK